MPSGCSAAAPSPPRPARGGAVPPPPPISTRAHSKPYSLASQSLEEVGARVADLDRLGANVQVIFPSVFLEALTEDLGFEAALIRCYNSWIAERCSQAPDRLKWAAVLPWRIPALAVEE